MLNEERPPELIEMAAKHAEYKAAQAALAAAELAYKEWTPGEVNRTNLAHAVAQARETEKTAFRAFMTAVEACLPKRGR